MAMASLTTASRREYDLQFDASDKLAQAVMLKIVLRDRALFGGKPEANLAFLKNAIQYLLFQAEQSFYQASKLNKDKIASAITGNLGVPARPSPQENQPISLAMPTIPATIDG
jgi:hypothetical protein